MKRIVMVMMMMFSTFLFAESDATHSTIASDGTTQLMVGDNMIFIYENNEAADVTKPNQLKLMAKILEKKLCGDQDTKNLIDAGINAIFIYPTKDHKGTTVITINKCN